MTDLRKWIDAAYVINLAERKERRGFMSWQLKQLCIDESSVTWHTSVLHPFNDVLINGFNAWSQKNHGFFTKPNELSCLYEHYTIIKKSWLQGMEKILVMEDDICFLRDNEKLTKMLDVLPESCDIAQGDGYCIDSHLVGALDKSQAWSRHDGIGVWNASFVILSRKGMKFYIDFIDQFFSAADMPYYIAAQAYSASLDVRLASKPVCIQEDKGILKSNIRFANQETRANNAYLEGVDISEYFTIKDIENEKQ